MNYLLNGNAVDDNMIFTLIWDSEVLGLGVIHFYIMDIFGYYKIVYLIS